MYHEAPIRAEDLTGPFRGSLALAEKALTERQLRSKLFVSLFRDVFLPVGIPITHELRCRAATLVAPSAAVLTGHSAGNLLGLELARPSDPVELLVPEGHQFRSYPGMNVRRVPIMDDEYEAVIGMLVATPSRMALDLLLNTRLRKTLAAAVAALDVVLHRGLIDLDRLRDQFGRRHDHGIVRARDAVALADARAESIPESILRVLLVRAGIEVTPQVEVFWHGRFVARVDLAIEDIRLAIEYDGEWHSDPEQAGRDHQRRAWLKRAGWQVIVVTKNDLYEQPQKIVAAVRSVVLCTKRRG